MICRRHLNLLAIETSTEFLSLAVSREAAVRLLHVEAGKRHAELILDAIGTLMGELDLDLRDLHGIAYGAGPGSFTGLRIACGVAQGLALSRSLKVLGISNLLALAEESGQARVIACIDARMGEIYHGAYRRGPAGWEQVHAPGLCKPESLPLPQGDGGDDGGGWVGCGNGFLAHGEALRVRLGGSLREVQAGLAPTAAAVLRLARVSFERGEGAEPASAVPIYLRDKVALKRSETVSAVVKPLASPEPMSEDDLVEVLAVEQSIYEFPWSCGNFVDSLRAGYRCLVYRGESGIVGYAVMMLGAGEAHLLNLSVAAREQRRGHGTGLLQHLIEMARDEGARLLFLEVRPSNAAGRLLYAKHGFRQVGVRRGYYPAREGREDALVLGLDL